MGAFDYNGAVDSFTALTERYPDWELARVNLAISTLNRQQEGDEERALALAGAVLEQSPDHLHASYISGILLFNQGDLVGAQAYFERVHALDPSDAYAAYYAGQCMMQLGDAGKALSLFEHAIERDSYLRSAYYGAFQAQQRLGNRDAARRMLEVYQRLDLNPRSRLAEIKYTRMGPYAMVMPVRDTQADVSASASSEKTAALFQLRTPLEASEQELAAAGSRALILDDERHHLALIITAGQLKLLDLKTNSWLAASEYPFLTTTDVRTASFGDIDNDGLTDLYLGRTGSDQLWRQDETIWTNVTEEHAISEARVSHDSMMIDADHDGDLDLLLATSDGIVLWSNNGNGSFRSLTESNLPQWQRAGLTRVSAWDIDSDRDLDLMALSELAESALYSNDRLWNYQLSDELSPLWQVVPVSINLHDSNVDGLAEIVTVSSSGLIQQWDRQGRDADFSLRSDLGKVAIADDVTSWIQDLDGDGRAEILVSSLAGYTVVSQQGEVLHQSTDDRVLAVINRSAEQRPGLLVIGSGGLARLDSDIPARNFVAMGFSGLEDPGQSMRSNASGLGTAYVVRSGSLWSAGAQLRHHSGPGQRASACGCGHRSSPAGRLCGDRLE